MPSCEERIAEIKDAIAHLETQRALLGDAAVDTAVAALRDKLVVLWSESRPEQRKLVTVLFCDLVGFTSMAEGRDPEDVREVLALFFQPWREAILRHDGHLDKYIGDAVMAVFGIPAASEDDPEHAIRAALEVRDGLESLNAAVEARFGVRLAMRVGVNTGPVLVGALGKEGATTVAGDAVNLASRLQSEAPTNGILISHSTYRHVRGLFDVQVQEPIQVRGKSDPVRTYVVQRARPRAFHRGMRGVEGVETQMIGRQAELARLQDALDTVVEDREQQTVTITGEAGVGKSRLLYEFENWVDLLPDRIFLFKGRASRERQGMPYSLLSDLFTFRFQIQDSDPAGLVREKLEKGIGEALGQEGQGEAKAHFVGQLLGLDLSDSVHLQEVLDDAQQLRDRSLGYLVDYFRAMTARLPTAILLEDVHWADDSSLDALNRLALAMSDQPLLIVCLARPSLYDRRPHWGEGQAFHTRLALRPLSKRESRRLVEEILQRAEAVPPALRELVVSRAEGNPFYVEELIKMLLEDGVIVAEGPRWHIKPSRLTSVPVPPTLTGVLQARLDRLPLEERTVAQQASVVGRRFWDRVVVRLGESVAEARGETEVLAALSALRHREMVFLREASSLSGTQEYIFKHALLREVTYESVLKRVRQAYHAVVAEWLVERSGERAGEYTGLIADHLEAAGQTEEAIAYLGRAGAQAAGRFAHAEAAAYFSRALDLIEEEDPPGRMAERYDLLLSRERAYELQGAREAQRQDLEALSALAEAMGGDGREAAARWAEVALRRARWAQVTSDFPAAIVASQTAIHWAGEAEDLEREAQGHLIWGRVHWDQAEYPAAQFRFQRALDLVQCAPRPAPGLGSGPLSLVEADILRNLGNVFARQADYARARTYYEQSLRISREIPSRLREGEALNNLGLVSFFEGDSDGARCFFDAALEIHREIGNRLDTARASTNLGAVHMVQGDFAGASACYEEALQIHRETGNRHSEGIVLEHLADLSVTAGDYARARAYCEAALQISQQVGGWGIELPVLEVLGAVATAQGSFAEALACYEKALHIARETGRRRDEGIALVGQGACCAWYGDYPGALTRFEQAVAIFRETGAQREESWALSRLGLAHHCQGDQEGARETCQQALRIAQERQIRYLEADALAILGHALASLGQLAQAAGAYQQALDIRRALGLAHLVPEALAGLARVSLAQGELQRAQAVVEEILTYLETKPLDGTEPIFRIYLTCYRVLRANQDGRAPEVLGMAHRLLQEQAAQIEDPHLRASFLENVAAHRAIERAWERRGSRPHRHRNGGDIPYG